MRDALRPVGLPSGSVAVGVGSRGVAGIGEVVKALVNALKQAGAEPFVVPAMEATGPLPPRDRYGCWSTSA